MSPQSIILRKLISLLIFCKLMDGTTKTFEQHIDDDRLLQDSLAFQSDLIDRQADGVIGSVALTRVAVKRSMGNAPGSNGIVAELQKVLPDAMVRLIEPLALKTTLALSPPLQSRGGDIALVPKGGATSVSSISTVRDVWLVDDISKTIEAALRKNLVVGIKTN